MINRYSHQCDLYQDWDLLHEKKTRNGTLTVIIKISTKDSYWWLARVTFTVPFGFLTQNFGMWWGHTIGTLLFYECRFSGGDTMRCWGDSNPTLCKRIWSFCTHRQQGCKNFRCQHLRHRLYPSHLMKLSLTTFAYFQISHLIIQFNCTLKVVNWIGVPSGFSALGK